MKKVFYVLFLSLVLSSCEKTESLSGKNYSLLNSENNVPVTLEFNEQENRYSGGVVNRFFGAYELDGNKITFIPAGVTMMMGPQEAMTAESDFLKTLPQVVSYELKDNKLILVTNENKELVFEEDRSFLD